MVPTLAPALRVGRFGAGARAAERPEFGEVAREHLDGVYRYVHGMVRDGDLAEDLTAAAFEKGLRAWRSYDPARAQPRTWLCSIARNVVLDHWRGERRRREREDALVAEAAAAPPAAEPQPGIDPALSRALDRLKPAEREVVALRVLLDMSCDEAAEVMGISTTACSTYLHRVLAKLRKEVPRGA